MDRREIKRKSKEEVVGTIGTFFGVLIVLFISSIIQQAIARTGYDIILIIYNVFVASILTFGIAYMCLKRTGDDKDISIKDVFCGFTMYGKALGVTVLQVVFVFLWGALIIAGTTILISVMAKIGGAFMLLLIAIAYVSMIIAIMCVAYKYVMATYIIIEDNSLTPMEAINESKTMMRGHTFELFKFQVSFFPWFILCAVTFGIAIIYVLPYMGIAQANFYRNLREQA